LGSEFSHFEGITHSLLTGAIIGDFGVGNEHFEAGAGRSGAVNLDGGTANDVLRINTGNRCRKIGNNQRKVEEIRVGLQTAVYSRKTIASGKE
jgi:hypothetical protein